MEPEIKFLIKMFSYILGNIYYLGQGIAQW